MPQNSTPAPRPLVHLVARILFLCVVGSIALVVATAPTHHQGMVNPDAVLDTSNVTYLGYQPGSVGLAAGADVLQHGAPAQAVAAPAEDADLHAAACELSWAFHSGATIHGDLSFAGATGAYRAVNDELDRRFDAYTGKAWPAALTDLEDFLDDQITHPCSDLDSGA